MKNLQGDIIAIVNASGTKVVEYTYDAWGKLLSKTGSMASTLGTLNPFRYRGYVYDEETGLYYLRTRYYNPELERFINEDMIFDPSAEMLQHNLFAYCANNPITFKDNSGTGLVLACVLIGSLIGIIAGAVIGDSVARSNGYNIEDGWDYLKYVMGFAALGGALGGLTGWAFAGTKVAATISWTYFQSHTVIGTSSYAIGKAFEDWFYKVYNVIYRLIHSGRRFKKYIYSLPICGSSNDLEVIDKQFPRLNK